MRILVIGGAGMLGHELLSGLSTQHDTRVTVRRDLQSYARFGLFTRDNTYDCVDVRDLDRVASVLSDYRPDAVINAAGIVKQRAEAQQPIPSIEVNALFPHRLAALATGARARLIHISTDCVFSGRKGSYVESDTPDPTDLYGLTKLLGEVRSVGAITIRTSIIGLELASCQGLVEWALAQTGEIGGYRRHIYSGLTTPQLTRVIQTILTEHPNLDGLWHVASEPISKFNLLTRLFNLLGRTDVTTRPDDAEACDRSLRADAFTDVTGYRVPGWEEMLMELATRVQQREATKRQ